MRSASQVRTPNPNQNPLPGPAGPRAPALAAQPGLLTPQSRVGGRPVHHEADRVARWKVVAMPYSRAGLTPVEQQMIAKLADACHLMDEIYLHQSDLGGWAIYHVTQNANVYRLFSINGSRWDVSEPGHDSSF